MISAKSQGRHLAGATRTPTGPWPAPLRRQQVAPQIDLYPAIEKWLDNGRTWQEIFISDTLRVRFRPRRLT